MDSDAIDIIRDPGRLATLRRTDLLNGRSSEALDRLTRLTSRLLHAPLTLVNLIDADRQVSVSCVAPEQWSGSREAPLEDSYCTHAVVAREPLVIEDTRLDSRVARSRMTTEVGLRAYLGIPLITSSGEALGSLCIADLQPRRWTDNDIRTLQELANAAVSEIELRLAVRQARDAESLAEVADRERREKMALLESTTEGIYGIDTEGRCTFVNRAALRMLGRTAEECLGREMHQLIHHTRPDGTPFPASECPIQRTLGQHRSAHLDNELLWRKDGSSFHARYSAAPIREDGEMRGAVVTFADITKRIRAEEAERFFNHASRVLAAESLDYTATLRTLVQLSAPALGDWCTLYMARPDGGLERLELAHADPDKAELAEALKRYPPGPGHPALRALQTGEAQLFPTVPDALVQQVAQDEEHLRILRGLGMQSGMVVPLKARGRTLGALIIVSSQPDRQYTPDDLAVAEEFAYRAALAVDNARLYRHSEEANRTKTEFLATVSHELRTPLNAIVGYSDLMREGIPAPLPAGSLEYVQRIGLSARHLRQLIEEILTFSRLEAGRENVARVPVDVDELLREVRAVIEPLARDKQLRFELRVQEGMDAVCSDPAKLRQVLVNLLDNAVKFTSQGEVGVEVRSEGGHATFRVWDTGIGIAEEDQEAAFEPFRQLEQSSTREVGGTGLGLSVVQRLVHLLGGTLRMQSELGRGTSVEVTLGE